jgi:hypothetical protein
MDGLAAFLLLLFLTPVGWIRMFVFAISIAILRS